MCDKKDTLCILPFIQMQIGIDGAYTICCNNEFYDSQGKVLAFPEVDVTSFWNHSSLVRVRRDMLEGKWPEECKYCQEAEARNERSQREIQWEIYQENSLVQEIIDDCRQNNGIIKKSAPRNWLMLFENTCNLKCRMCRDRCSSSMANENYQIGFSTQLFEASNWYEQGFEKAIESSIGDIDVVYLAGGEPTIMKSASSFLDFLITRGFSKNIHIAFNTNVTTIPDDFYEKITLFKGATINLSIDGTGKVQEYIRYPSEWKNIERNVIKLIEVYENDVINLECFPTFGALNLLNLPELFTFFQRYHQIKHVFYNDIRDINDVNFRIIPDHLKAYVLNYYNEVLKGNMLDKYYSNLLRDIGDAVSNGTHNFKIFNRVIQKLAIQDRFRGIKAKNYIPKFCELIAKDGYDL